MHSKNLSLSAKINNENIRASLTQLEKKENLLKNKLSKVSIRGEKPINHKLYYGAFIFPILILIGHYLLNANLGSGSNPNEVNGTMAQGAVIFKGLFIALLFWIIFIGSYIGAPYCIIKSINEVLRTPKREEYLKIMKELKTLESDKLNLESKIIH